MEFEGETPPTETPPTETPPTETLSTETLADLLAADLTAVFGLFRSLSAPSGMSMTAAATLATIERNGPSRLTLLAAREGVTQPAMTQLISRLEDTGLVSREADPADGRVVLVTLTEEGRTTLAKRRAGRADRLAVILAQLSAEHRAALAAALPALAALAAVPREEDSTTATRA